MKKLLSVLLVSVMLAAMFIIPVNAAKEKTPFGTVLEVQYTTTAPDMSDALPDESWGGSLIHVTKDTPNSGLTDYNSLREDGAPVVSKDISMDIYARWTDTSLYICLTSPDKEPKGGVIPYNGDGYQMLLTYGIADISQLSALYCSTTNDEDYFVDNYSYTFTFSPDDYSLDTWGASLDLDNVTFFWDEKTQTIVSKMEIPFTNTGLSKKETAKDGDYLSLDVIRLEVESGWLEWGDYFNASKGIEIEDPGTRQLWYNWEAENKKTTSANSFKLVGKGGGAETPAEPEQPTQPTTPTEQPSDWAKAEVDAAIAAGLVPEALQNGYKGGTSRETLSKLLSVLLDKVYGKAPSKTDAKFSDTTDADVLKAANLGIINGYANGDGTFNFKPANTLKRSEMTAIINRVAKLCGKTVDGFDAEVKFADTASHWCNKELGWAVHQGIVKGTSATTFSPENTLTVEQSIMMIYRTFEALK